MINPDTVTVGNHSLNINTDFRTGILFEKLILSPEFDAKEKLIKSLTLYFDSLPADIDLQELIEQMLSFYKCGKIENYDGNETETGPHIVYDWDSDWRYIQAAFYQQYHIDLNTIENLHWWTFRGMFESLTDDTQFKKILGYRLIKINKNMSKEQKEYYSKMKKLYKLPDRRTEEEKEYDFGNAFG